MATDSPDAMVIDPRTGKTKYIRYAGAVKKQVEARRQREALEREAARVEGARLWKHFVLDLDVPVDRLRLLVDEAAVQGLLRYRDGRPERARIVTALRARWLAGLEMYVLCMAVETAQRRGTLRAIDRTVFVARLTTSITRVPSE